MFAHHPYASPYQSYSPYEQLLLQQEIQRRRQLEAYHLRRQIELEELNRRRQYEYALRQAAEAERRRQMEMEQETRRRNLAGPSCGRRHSMFDGGVQELFDALYGGQARSTSPRDQRSTSPQRSEHTSPSPSEQRQSDTDKRADLPQPTTLPVKFSEPLVASPATLSAEAEIETADDDQPSEVDTAASHATVNGILATFTSLSSNFTFPTPLDFLPSHNSSSPKLAYTPTNAPLHQYEHVLTGLLTRLDAVESYGDDGIRKSRKEAVRQIEKELEGLDSRKVEEWKRQFAPVAEAEAELQPQADVTTEVDPTRIPLPEDEDEQMEVAVPELSTASPSESASPSHVLPPLPLIDSDLSQNLLAKAFISEASDSEMGEYVDVDPDVEAEEVEQDRDLVAMKEWDLDF